MYNTMEIDVPQRWLQVSAITERLRSFTGKAIKNKLDNGKYMGESNKWFALHRLDQPQYVVHLNDEQYEEWGDLKHELKNMYQEEFPPKHIQITFFRDGDAPYSRKTSITEWDPSIPQDTSIEQDSPTV